MRRYSIYTTIIIVILLAMLAGSWVWFLGFSEEGERPEIIPDNPAGTASTDGTRGRHGDSDGAESRSGDYGAAEALEPRRHHEREPRPHRRAKPPEAMVDRSGQVEADSAENDEDEIVVERSSTNPGVVDSSGGDEGLDAFIVSTLKGPEFRQEQDSWLLDQESLSRLEQGLHPRATLRARLAGIPSGITHILSGKVNFPELEDSAARHLKDEHRLQLTMYTPELPRMRWIVDSDGRFSLPMTEDMVRNYKRRGQRVLIHSPAFRPKSGKNYVDFRKDRTEFEIDLELTPPVQIIVEVTPKSSLADDVHVWLERLGDPHGGDHDDSTYMRARVPASGRLHFFVSARYGKMSVAAAGRDWHSGHPLTWDLERVKGDVLRATLTLNRESCSPITGRIQDDSGTPLGGVRLVCTHYGVTTYTNPAGEFLAYTPFASIPTHRQFIATSAWMRPEVIPLEARADGTPGVTGNKLDGPFEVSMRGEIEIELRLPDKPAPVGAIYAAEERIARAVRDDSEIRRVKLKWGTRMLLVVVDMREVNQTFVIDDDDWADALRQYAKGNEVPVIRVEALSNVLE